MATMTWDRPDPFSWTLTMSRPVSPDGEKHRAESATFGEGDTGLTVLAALDDATLVRTCTEGRLEAFDVLVERHRRLVYQLCYRFVANHEDANDLSQEVFLRAYRALKGFRGQSSVATWLYRVGVNVCLNRVSVKTPQREPLDDNAHVDGAESATERLMRRERAAEVRRAVARLPEKQRAALILRVYHDMAHSEIAAALGTSAGAAKANVFHALRNLKRLLGEDVEEVGEAGKCGKGLKGGKAWKGGKDL